MSGFPVVIAAGCGLALAACGSAPEGAETVGQSTAQPLSIATPSKSLCNAVVGAGPAALTAADTLTQLEPGTSFPADVRRLWSVRRPTASNLAVLLDGSGLPHPFG